MKIFGVLTLTLVLLMSKCKRNEEFVNEPCTGDCITFNIKVGTDQKAKTPLNGIKLELGWEEKRYLYYNPGRLIGTATTSDDGTCEISFRAKQQELTNGYYYIKLFYTDEYFDKDEKKYRFYVSKPDTTLDAKIHLASKANFKVVFKNFNPKISGDFFNVYSQYKIYFPTSYLNSALPYHSFSFTDGAFSSKEIMGITAGNDYTYITVNRKINGVITQVVDSVFIAKGETKIYVVNYE